MYRNSILTFTLILTFSIFAQANIIYVNNALSTGSNNGTSWGNAYHDLQAALTAANSGDEIKIAYGTYHPHPTDRSVSFEIPNGVNLTGSYVISPNGASYQPYHYPTILSGNINNANINTDNSYYVVKAVNATSTLKGIHIVEGYASNSPSGFYKTGGGLFIDGNSHISLNLCRFEKNHAQSGGAIHISANAQLTINNSTFSQNTADGSGGAIHDLSNKNLHIEKVTFMSNSASGGAGGAISLANAIPTNKNIQIIKSSFKGNQAPGSGTITQGGAIFDAHKGNLLIESCLFSGNFSSTRGGALYFLGQPAQIINCTFAMNKATNAGSALEVVSPGAIAIKNCIFYQNQGNGNPVTVQVNTKIPVSNISHSYIQDPFYSSNNNITSGSIDFSNPLPSTTAIPTTGGNYYVQKGSVTIDKGDNNAPQISQDIYSKPRIQDSKVDMGAYEYVKKGKIVKPVQTTLEHIQLDQNAVFGPK